MKGWARLAARLQEAVTVAGTIECRAPIAMRVTGTPGPVLNVSMLHTGAGFLEGDEAFIEIEVAAGAAVALTSPGATMAYPCPKGGWSRTVVRVRVLAGGFLSWMPEPLIVAAGGRHRVESEAELADGAVVLWREEICAGRYKEPAGELRLTFAADLCGRPLLRDAVVFGPPGWDGPRTLSGAKFTGSVASLGSRLSDRPGVMQLAGPGSVLRALAPDAISLRKQLSCGQPLQQRREDFHGAQPALLK